MALIGTLSINLTANTRSLSAGLNSSARQVDAWSGRVGGVVDSAFAGLAKSGVGLAGKAAVGLAGSLDRVENTARKARTALNFVDAGRYLGQASIGAAKVSTALLGWSQAGRDARAGLSGLGARLSAVGEVSKQARRALFWTEAGVLFAKLATVGGGALGTVVSGLGRVAAGSARATVGVVGFGAGVAAAASGTVRFAADLAAVGAGLAKATAGATLYVASLGRLGAASRMVRSGLSGGFAAGLKAVFDSGSVARGLGGMVAGLRNVSGGLAAASVGVVRFGTGLVGLGLSAATSAVGALAGAVGGLGSAFASAAITGAKFAAIGGVIAATLGVKAAASAAHLNEAVNTTEQVFGKAADRVVRSAEKMNQAYGTNRKEYLAGANALGSQFQTVGYGEDAAAALSERILKLAADANAARDPVGGFAEALGKIRSGLSGEQEPLKAWGLDLSDNAVKLEAVSMGLVKQGAEMTNATKVQARMSLITKGLAKEQGALAREATGPAAQIAEFWGRAQTLMETVGASLAPVLGSALEVVNTAVVALTDSWGALSGGVVEFVSGVGASVGEWAASVAAFFEIGEGRTSLWRVSLGFLANAWQAVGIAFKGVSTVILANLAHVFDGLSYLGTAVDKVMTVITGESSGLADYFERLGTKMHKIAVDQADGLAKEWAKPWASATDAPDKMAAALTSIPEKVKAAYDAAAEKIKTVRAEMAKPVAENVEPPKGADVAAKEKAGKSRDVFSAAHTMGSADAATVVLRSKYGSVGKDGTAENTKRSADALARIDLHQKEMVRILRDRSDGLVPLAL